jgi:hypothetical protein
MRDQYNFLGSEDIRNKIPIKKVNKYGQYKKSNPEIFFCIEVKDIIE